MTGHDGFLLDRIVPWASGEETVRAVAELGSRTRGDVDEWADMDLLLLVRDKERITDSDEWIAEIGDYWVAVRHPGPFDDLPVRQVLFDGGLDFDIVPIEAGTLAERLADPGIAFALTGGYGGGLRIVLDKDGELAEADLRAQTPSDDGAAVTRHTFDFVVGDFLFQVVWAAKHLRRGELWAAKDDVDCYMKADLVRLLEWEALTRGEGERVRSGGRYLEKWTTPEILDRLPGTFPGYDARQVADALLALMDLFGDVGERVAARLGFEYPQTGHRRIRSWAEDCLQPI